MKFPKCISCHSDYDVDIDEISDQGSKIYYAWICRKCGIEWEESK